MIIIRWILFFRQWKGLQPRAEKFSCGLWVRVAPLALQKIKAAKGIKTEFIDYVPHEESVKYLLKSNALLLIIPDIRSE